MADENKSAVQQFLEGTGNEQNMFAPEESKDPFDKPIEESKEEPVVKEERLPFAKDPKIQKYLDKEIAKRLADFKPEPIKEEKPQIDMDREEMLFQTFGNESPERIAMAKRWGNYLDSLKGAAKAEAIAEIQGYQQAEVEADKEAEDELSNAFDNIEETFDVDITSNNPLAKKTRQEFVSFVEKLAPKDRNGDVVDYPDMQSAWETFSEMKKATSTPSRAKELASRSMTRSAETKVEVQGRPSWDAVDAYIESLK